MVEGEPVVGYNTPSRKLELFSKTLADWKWPEFALPEYYRSHIHRSAHGSFDWESRPRILIPKYMPRRRMAKRCARRGLHTCCRFSACRTSFIRDRGIRSFFTKSAHKNPLWVNPVDAKQIGDIRTGDLLKVHTEIGFFVLHAWVTEGLAPGVVACSHHHGALANQ